MTSSNHSWIKSHWMKMVTLNILSLWLSLILSKKADRVSHFFFLLILIPFRFNKLADPFAVTCVNSHSEKSVASRSNLCNLSGWGIEHPLQRQKSETFTTRPSGWFNVLWLTLMLIGL